MENDWHKTENVFVFDICEKNNLTFVLYVFGGISALVEIPKNCVVAAVGKELSEYEFFSFSFSSCIFSMRIVYTCWKDYFVFYLRDISLCPSLGFLGSLKWYRDWDIFRMLGQVSFSYQSFNQYVSLVKQYIASYSKIPVSRSLHNIPTKVEFPISSMCIRKSSLFYWLKSSFDNHSGCQD